MPCLPVRHCRAARTIQCDGMRCAALHCTALRCTAPHTGGVGSGACLRLQKRSESSYFFRMSRQGRQTRLPITALPAASRLVLAAHSCLRMPECARAERCAVFGVHWRIPCQTQARQDGPLSEPPAPKRTTGPFQPCRHGTGPFEPCRHGTRQRAAAASWKRA